MLSFFIKTGDPEVDAVFMPYMWGDEGLKGFIETHVNACNYGRGLKLLLIKVYVEGRFEVYGPENILVSNYSKIREETTVAFTVHQTNFDGRSDNERKTFLAKMVLSAVEEVRAKHGKKIPNFNFELFEKNLNAALYFYMER